MVKEIELEGETSWGLGATNQTELCSVSQCTPSPSELVPACFLDVTRAESDVVLVK